MTDGTARLRALARDAAARNHVRWKQGTKKFTESGHNGLSQFDCLHPDCVLVREPADAPVGLRALVEQWRADAAFNPLQTSPGYSHGRQKSADDLDAALLRLGAETKALSVDKDKNEQDGARMQTGNPNSSLTASANQPQGRRCAFCGTTVDDGFACAGNGGKLHWMRDQ